jgi:hypothetical protein
MIGLTSLLSKYFLQTEQPWDIPTIEDKPQEFSDEDQVNESIEQVGDAFSGLRDAGDWVIEFFTDLFSQIFGNIF